MTNAMRILKALHELGATEETGDWAKKKELSEKCASTVPHAIFEHPDRFAYTMWAALIDKLVSIRRENRCLLLQLTVRGEELLLEQGAV